MFASHDTSDSPLPPCGAAAPARLVVPLLHRSKLELEPAPSPRASPSAIPNSAMSVSSVRGRLLAFRYATTASNEPDMAGTRACSSRQSSEPWLYDDLRSSSSTGRHAHTSILLSISTWYEISYKCTCIPSSCPDRSGPVSSGLAKRFLLRTFAHEVG